MIIKMSMDGETITFLDNVDRVDYCGIIMEGPLKVHEAQFDITNKEPGKYGFLWMDVMTGRGDILGEFGRS